MTAGKSILERLWEELDSIVDHIMSECEGMSPEEDFLNGSDTTGPEILRYGEWRGQAQGVAYAIAMMTNPYAPNVDAIREKAMQRWEEADDE